MVPASLDKEFIDLVAQDVRGVLPKDKHDKLNKESNLDRLYDALIALKKDVEVQLSNHRSRASYRYHEFVYEDDDFEGWIEFRAEEADWRARAVKFLMEIEDHISAVKARRRELNKPQEDTSDKDLLTELIDGIFEQRDAVNRSEITDEDQRVFSLAEKLRK